MNLSDVLAMFRGNQSQAARFLNMNRGTLRKKIKDDSSDVIVSNGNVYKKIGEPDWSELTPEQKRYYFEGSGK